MVLGAAARASFWFHWGLSAALWRSIGCVGLCLRDGIPEEQRQNLQVPRSIGAGEIPLGIWTGNWPSAQLVAHLIKLLAEEGLGYRTIISAGTHSISGVYACGGCETPLSYGIDAGCKDVPTFSHHLCTEIWGLTKINQAEPNVAPGNMPENLGSLGYDGSEGIHVLEHDRSIAYASEGLSLDHYTAYDAAWQNPSQFFDSISEIQSTDLQLCNETDIYDSGVVAAYHNITGDTEGVVERGDGTMVGRCWRGSWWAGPRCRENLESCVPILTVQGGWFTPDIMQKATLHNLSWAFASMKSISLWETIAKEKKVLLYWWKPDAGLAGLGASMVGFPTFDREARLRGHRAAEAARSVLWTAAHRRLREASPRLRGFAVRFSLSLQHMQEMLGKHKEAGGEDFEKVVCDWVGQNEDVWRAWIPPLIDCISGQGLVNATGVPVWGIENATGCAWCPPGSMSTTVRQGQGQGGSDEFYVCIPCEPGRSQANLGQQECGNCSQGTFAEAAGSSQCHRCLVGSYQPIVGSSGCEQCPQPMTTELQGSDNSSQCVCPEGSFAPENPPPDSPPCTACPEGMVCGLGVFPQPSKRYYTTVADPLSVYACPDDSCPGGGPERCVRNTKGLACGGCVRRYYRSAQGCESCDGMSHYTLAIPIFVSLLSPLAVCLLYMKSKDPLHKWGSPVNSLGALAYLGFAFVQIIAASQMANLSYPDSIVSSFSWTTATVDVLATFSPECSGVLSFNLTFLLRLMMPLYTIVVFLVTWLISRIVERCIPGCHMDGDRLAGCFGNVYMMFFVGIAAQTFSLFRCYGHPNGKFSLLSAPEILCDSQAWQDLVLASVIAIVVCCGGALAFTTYINVKTPFHFHEDLFRRRWRFLLMRYRPGVWWWGTVLMIKGVLLNLTLVIFTEGRNQLVCLTFTHLLYLVTVCLLLPWRSLCASSMDLIMHSVLLAAFSIVPFCLVAGEAKPLTQLVYPFDLVLSICLLPFIAAPFLALMQLGLSLRSPVDRQKQAELLCSSFGRITGPEELVKLLEVLPTLDLFVLERTCLISQRLLLFERGDSRIGSLVQRHSSMYYDERAFAALAKTSTLDRSSRPNTFRDTTSPEAACPHESRPDEPAALVDMSSVKTEFV